MAAGFGFDQLKKCGWKEGQGLGKLETGIAEPIKAKIKNDRLGVGSDVGEEFSFHWWQHVFNSAAANLTVKNDHEAGEVTVLKKEEYFGPISNKKAAHQNHQKKKRRKVTSNIYKNFVQANTFYHGEETSGKRVLPGSDSESEEIAGATVTDHDLYLACGSRTAHKAARHGLALSGKLLRVDRQEQDFTDSQDLPLTKQNSDSQDLQPNKMNSAAIAVSEVEGGDKSKVKKKDKKKRKKLLENVKDSKKLRKTKKRKST